MKTFEISSIELENIKTYKYEKIDFYQGNNVLIGDNGAGKSTILESIYLSLFGDTVPGRNLVDMIRYGEKQGKIIIRFNVNGSNYRITDELTKREETRATQTQVLINETLEDTIAEGRNAVRLKIEEILDIDATTFISAVYASQGEIGQIVTAKDKERKKLFDRLFQIDRYEKAWSNLSKVEKIINSEINNLENHIDIISKDLTQLPEIEDNITEKKTQLKNDKKNLLGLRTTYKEYDQKYKQLDKLVSKHNKLLGEKGTLEEEESELNHQIFVLFESISSKAREEINDFKLTDAKKLLKKYENKVTKAKESLESLRQEENNIKIALEKKNNLERTFTILNNSIIQETNNLNGELEQFKTKISELEDPFENWEVQLPTLMQKRQKTLEKIEKQEKELQKSINNISKLEVKLKSLKESEDRYHSRIVKKRLILSQEAGDSWKELINDFSKINFDEKLQKLSSDIDSLAKNHSELVNQKTVTCEGLKRIQGDLQHLKSLDGEETCPTCKQTLSPETFYNLRNSLNNEKSDLQEKKKEIVQKIKDLSSLLDELNKEEKELSKQHQLYEKIEPTFTDLQDLEKEKKSVEAYYKKLAKEIDVLKSKYSVDKIDELEIEIDDLKESIREISALEKRLPKFLINKQKIKEDTTETKKLEEEILQLKSEFDEKTYVKVNGKINKLEEEHEHFADILEISKELTSNYDDLKANSEKLKANSTKIAKIEVIDDFKNWEDVKTNREKIGNDISALESSVNMLANEVIPPLLERKRKLQVKEKELKKTESDLKLENKKKEIVSILRALMRELPNRLLPNFIERINNAATEILQSIIPGSDIQSIILNDDYSLNIIRLGNIENITVLSGGETIIIALALRLAFAKEFSALDSLILDEPTIFLDERRRGELVTVLERNRLVRQMFVVTHDPDFERISDQTYFITKEGGETTVEAIDDKEETDENNLINLKLS